MDARASFAAEFLERAGLAFKGGPGSGNHGHAGRPGKVGGSANQDKVTPIQAEEDLKSLDQSFERYYAFDSKGNLVSKGDGQSGEVYIPDDLTPRLKGGLIIHNHPSDTALSEGDIEAAIDSGYGEIRSVARNGAVFSFRVDSEVKEKFNAPPANFVFRGEKIVQEGILSLKQIYQDAYNQAIKHYDRPEFWNRKDVWVLVHNLTMQKFVAMAKKERGFKFSYLYKGPTLQKELSNAFKGGPGSGNLGHAGIPGHLGGSAPKQLYSLFIDSKYRPRFVDYFHSKAEAEAAAKALKLKPYETARIKKEKPGKTVIELSPEDKARRVKDELIMSGEDPRSGKATQTLEEAEATLKKNHDEGKRYTDFAYDLNAEDSAGRSFLLHTTGAKKAWFGYGEDSRFTDSVTHKRSQGIFLEDEEGTQLYAGLSDDLGRITIGYLFKEPSKGMLGIKFMRAMKRYADLTGKEIRVEMVANPEYFRKFPWLEDMGGSGMTFRYRPESRIKEAFFNNIAEAFKGGPGSGNYGHAGRPGKRGGSRPGGGGHAIREEPPADDWLAMLLTPYKPPKLTQEERDLIKKSDDLAAEIEKQKKGYEEALAHPPKKSGKTGFIGGDALSPFSIDKVNQKRWRSNVFRWKEDWDNAILRKKKFDKEHDIKSLREKLAEEEAESKKISEGREAIPPGHKRGEEIYHIPKSSRPRDKLAFNELPNQPGYWFTSGRHAYNITDIRKNAGPNKTIEKPFHLRYVQNGKLYGKDFEDFSAAWEFARKHAIKYNPDELE